MQHWRSDYRLSNEANVFFFWPTSVFWVWEKAVTRVVLIIASIVVTNMVGLGRIQTSDGFENDRANAGIS